MNGYDHSSSSRVTASVFPRTPSSLHNYSSSNGNGWQHHPQFSPRDGTPGLSVAMDDRGILGHTEPWLTLLVVKDKDITGPHIKKKMDDWGVIPAQDYIFICSEEEEHFLAEPCKGFTMKSLADQLRPHSLHESLVNDDTDSPVPPQPYPQKVIFHRRQFENGEVVRRRNIIVSCTHKQFNDGMADFLLRVAGSAKYNYRRCIIFCRNSYNEVKEQAVKKAMKRNGVESNGTASKTLHEEDGDNESKRKILKMTNQPKRKKTRRPRITNNKLKEWMGISPDHHAAENGEKCDEEDDIFFSSSSESGSEDDDSNKNGFVEFVADVAFRPSYPKHAHEVNKLEPVLSLLSTINNLPTSEMTAHWHQSFGRFLHANVTKSDEQVIFVYKTPFNKNQVTYDEKAFVAGPECWEEVRPQRSKKFGKKAMTLLITHDDKEEHIADAVDIEKLFANHETFHVKRVPVRNLNNELRDETQMIFMWYHAGHGQQTAFSDFDYSYLPDMVGVDKIQLVFFNMCFGRNAVQFLQQRIDNILYWDAETDNDACPVVAREFFKAFNERFGHMNLYKCVQESYQHVKDLVEAQRLECSIEHFLGGQRNVKFKFEQYRPRNACSQDMIVAGDFILRQVGRPIVGNSEMILKIDDTMPELRFPACPSTSLSLPPASRERAVIPADATFYCYMAGLEDLTINKFNSLMKAYEKVRRKQLQYITDGRDKEEDVAEKLKMFELLLRGGAFVYMRDDMDEHGVPTGKKQVLHVNVMSVQQDLFSYPSKVLKGILNTEGFQAAPELLLNKLGSAGRLTNIAQQQIGRPIIGKDPEGRCICKVVGFIRPGEDLHGQCARYSHGALVERWYSMEGPYLALEGWTLAIRRAA